MPRPEKVAAVADIKERIERAQAVFLAEYSGLSVRAQQDLRRGLRAQGAEFKVVKMTLTRRAAAELELEELDELLVGPTGIAFADGDPVNAAKVLKDFAANHEVFAVKGGLLGMSFLSPERVKTLAEIAPREVLLAQIAGGLKAPLTAMAGLLAALPRSAATVFQQLLDKKASVVETPAPEAETAAASEAEPPGDETAADETAPALDAVETPADETEGEAAAEVPASDDDASASVDDAQAEAAAEATDETPDGEGETVQEDPSDESPVAEAADVGDEDQEPAGEAEEE